MPTPERLTLLRAVYKKFEDDAIPTRSAKGRFHTAVGSTSYLAENSETAWREVSFRWQAEQSEYRLAQAELQVHTWLDLTDKKTQLKYGIDIAQLVADDHTYCQRLAERLRAKGIEAIRTYSRADQPDGRSWVVFLECLKPQSSLKVVQVGPMPPLAPKTRTSRKLSKRSAPATRSRKKT